MAVTNFSPLLGLALPTTGDLSGTWGTAVNDQITQLLDSAVAGTTVLSADADVTLSTTNGAANQARSAIIRWTASNGANTRNITAPAQSKAYLVINAGTGSVVIRAAGPTTGITLPAGTRALVAFNGSDFVKVASNPAVLTTDVSGVLPVANGGTGVTSSTGTVAVVLSTSPTLVTPVLGTPTSVTLTNATGLPITTGVSGLGTGVATFLSTPLGIDVATFLSTPTSANLAAAVTGETGTGALVFATSPTLVTPALGTPSSGVVTNLTGTASININGTVGATTASTGAFTTLTASTTLGVTGLSTLTAGAVVQGLTVGRGANAVSTNTAVGTDALAANTTANNNTATGLSALKSNTTGADNTAVGAQALEKNISGVGAVAVGFRALEKNTTGNQNTAVGAVALSSNLTGFGGTALGTAALLFNTTGTNNTAVGSSTLLLNTIGSGNTAAGHGALKSNTTGTANTAVGKNAGQSNTTGNGNTFLGDAAGTGVTTGENLTVIGINATASSSNAINEVTLGNSSIATLRCQVTTITALSDYRDKENIQELQAGLDFVRKLKPVSFDWNMRDGGKVGIADTGFIAQDLKQVQIDTGIIIPDLVYEGNPERLEAGYGKLLPVLVKAIQELKAEFDAYKATHP